MKYFPRVLHYLKPYKWSACIAVFLVLLGAGFSLLTPWPLQILIDHVFDQKPFHPFLGFFLNPIADQRLLPVVVPTPFPPFFGFILNPIADHRLLLLVIVTSATLVITLLQNAVTVLNEYVMTKVDQSMVLDFRSDMMQHAQRLSLAFHDQRPRAKSSSPSTTWAATLRDC